MRIIGQSGNLPAFFTGLGSRFARVPLEKRMINWSVQVGVERAWPAHHIVPSGFFAILPRNLPILDVSAVRVSSSPTVQEYKAGILM